LEEPGANAACRHIVHASKAMIPVIIAVMVASFLFDAGLHSYFSFANVVQASFAKYQSQAPYPFTNCTAAFRIFFLTPGSG